MIRGIDVSIWNGRIDWKKVRDYGIEFAMIRSSYGDGSSNFINNGIDENFEYNYAESGSVGIARGVYHYSYARSVHEAKKEAEFFLSRIDGKKFEYPVILDIEDEKVQGHLKGERLTEIAKTFLEIIEGKGYYVGIYSSRYWFDNYLIMDRLSNYDVWLAEWCNNLGYSGNYGIWQYSSTGSIDGIEGYVDLNLSYLDYPQIIKGAGLNGFNKVKDSEIGIDLIVYSNPMDRMAAEILSGAKGVPLYYNENSVLNGVNYVNALHVGSYTGNNERIKKVISGRDRFDTIKLVMKEVDKT